MDEQVSSSISISNNNLISKPIAQFIFSYLPKLSYQVRILCTSKSNPLKDALITYWKYKKNFEYPFYVFNAFQFFNYIKFFRSVQNITLNQHQRALTHSLKTVKTDLIQFLETFHQKEPEITNQIETLRLMNLLYDSHYDDFYYSGSLIDISNYSVFLDNSRKKNINDGALKYANLKCFISAGDSNMIHSKHVKYISNQTTNLQVININNLDKCDGNGIFKNLFKKHQHLTFFRLRFSYECSPTICITTNDFIDDNIHLNNLQFISIENAAFFSWNKQFLHVLSKILNPKKLKFIYLTYDGLRCMSYEQRTLYHTFQTQFKQAICQQSELRTNWHKSIYFNQSSASN